MLISDKDLNRYNYNEPRIYEERMGRGPQEYAIIPETVCLIDNGAIIWHSITT
jgi:hypothetical protein